MSVVAVVFDTEQAVVGGLCIGKYIPGCRAIDKPLFQQEPDKTALRHNQLFGGGAEIGALLHVDEQVKKGGLAFQQSVFLPQHRIFFTLSQQFGAELQQRLRGSGHFPQLFPGHVSSVLADGGQHLRRDPPAKLLCFGELTLQNCPQQRLWSAEWHFPNR